MGVEHPENGENERERIAEELKQVHQMLTELEAMQPLLHEDIARAQANIDRLNDRLANYSELAEQQLEAGQLEERNAFTVAKAMNDIAGDLEAFTRDKDLLLDTRMTLERTIVDLRKEAEELLQEFPKGTEH